jgi:hypothetical protein
MTRSSRLLHGLLCASTLIACHTDIAEQLSRVEATPVEDAGEPDGGPPDTAEAGEAGDSSDDGGGSSTPMADAEPPEKPEPPQASNQCNDGVQNGVETSVDCGGGVCAACGVGLACRDDIDCKSGLCFGDCIATGCGNEFQDANESDQDCGGVCEPCEDGEQCDTERDCKSGVCDPNDGKCDAPSCWDGIQNGFESGQDCGFDSDCGLCPIGEGCLGNRDCEDDVCVSDECAPAGCVDEIENGSETDVDCGGRCPACEADKECAQASDCQSGNCEDNGTGRLFCRDAACDDQVLNADETDVDCGGSCEDDCEVNQRCQTADDCIEKVCRRDDEDDARVCKAPTCDDQVKNGSETAIDCGGDCDQKCAIDDTCLAHADCISNSCGGVCLAPTCADGRLNQTETDADCGGEECESCSSGQQCEVNADCVSDDCTDLECAKGGAGAACRADGDCLNDVCDEDTCAPGDVGDPCQQDADCITVNCGSSDLCEPNYTGGACAGNRHCYSGDCAGDVCAQGELIAACASDADCYSGRCADDVCEELDLQLYTEALSEPNLIYIQVGIGAGSIDVSWDEVAFLYFFSPEARNNLEKNYESVAPQSSVCVGIDGDDWLYAWRSAQSGVIPSNRSYYTVQINDETWEAMNDDNDHSFQTTIGHNPNIVVCRLVDGQWHHVQGTAPSAASDPCQYVEPDCDTVTCDDLSQ